MTSYHDSEIKKCECASYKFVFTVGNDLCPICKHKKYSSLCGHCDEWHGKGDNCEIIFSIKKKFNSALSDIQKIYKDLLDKLTNRIFELEAKQEHDSHAFNERLDKLENTVNSIDEDMSFVPSFDALAPIVEQLIKKELQAMSEWDLPALIKIEKSKNK